MSLYSPRSLAVFAAAERAWLEPPEGPPDFLEGKPTGFCPWCEARLEEKAEDGEKYLDCGCDRWDPSETEKENRARYQESRENERGGICDADFEDDF